LVLNRHDRAVNVAFLDAHAETVKLPFLWSLKWNATWINPPSLPTIR
jgi:prepilin-type processing-associated H-X9-DG protein